MWRIFKNREGKLDESAKASLISRAESELVNCKGSLALWIADVHRASTKLLELLEAGSMSLKEFLQEPRNATLVVGWYTMYARAEMAKTWLRNFYQLLEREKTEIVFGLSSTNPALDRAMAQEPEVWQAIAAAAEQFAKDRNGDTISATLSSRNMSTRMRQWDS